VSTYADIRNRQDRIYLKSLSIKPPEPEQKVQMFSEVVQTELTRLSEEVQRQHYQTPPTPGLYLGRRVTPEEK
jgi:hypothetical protein